MNIKHSSSSWIIGLALFAMFFGSGNLIYPLFLGKTADGAWLPITLGFLVSAVLLPFCGVVAMVVYQGNYEKFFQTLGVRGGFWLTALLLTVWIPLGSAPRCMTLAYASIQSYFPLAPPNWVFCLIYSGLVFVVLTQKLGIIDIIGKWITPALIFCLATICLKGIFSSGDLAVTYLFDRSMFFKGMIEGYNTMDLIASFFFSATIIHLLNRSGSQMKQSVSLVFRSSIIGIAILALVYCPMIAVAAKYSEALENVPKDQLLATIAQMVLGSTWSVFAIIAIFLACFSTSIALILAYVDFLHDEVFRQKRSINFSIVLSLFITYVMSLFRLEGITYVSAPILQWCYPLLIGLIVFNLGRIYFKSLKVNCQNTKI